MTKAFREKLRPGIGLPFPSLHTLPALILVLLFLPPAPLAARWQDEPSRIWLGFGLGSGGSADGEGIALLGEFAWHRQPHAVTLRALAIGDVRSGSQGEFVDLGLLYGRTRTGQFGHVGLSAGLALTSVGPRCAGLTDCFVIGVPVAAEVALRLAPILGLGAQGFANINGETVYGGLVLFMQFGWLPTAGGRNSRRPRMRRAR